ncbi:hypothetical protein RHSIM_Rhsim09G0053900 [Rhododendron simsii]|uniref:DUF7794 domain-containing protein n=1 Tax=Rhododendron simsii TaxID=118357 RepID=A0A834GFX4_RHOSS|nr:hypothetical protein RHSIM_Rhsim09G0053900 [Rhododendron simsii]
MEDFQQQRSNPSPHHYFLGSTTDAVGGGGPLQGARTADAWVCFVDVSSPLSAFYQDRRWSQREEAKGCGLLWRLFNNRARTLADAIVSLIPLSRHCGGVILQGARLRVVAVTEQCLSSSGERARLTMCFCADSNRIHLAALLFELCHEAFHKFSMGFCIESLRRVVFNNTWKGLGGLLKSLSRMTLFARNATKEPTPSIDDDTWLGTGPDGLRIYLAFRIITQLKMRLHHYDNSEMSCVKSFKAFLSRKAKRVLNNFVLNGFSSHPISAAVLESLDVDLNEVLMPNPFDRPHAVFMLAVKGAEGA